MVIILSILLASFYKQLDTESTSCLHREKTKAKIFIHLS